MKLGMTIFYRFLLVLKWGVAAWIFIWVELYLFGRYFGCRPCLDHEEITGALAWSGTWLIYLMGVLLIPLTVAGMWVFQFVLVSPVKQKLDE